MKILLVDSTTLFTVDSIPGDLRMSNLASTWTACGARVTMMRFCRKDIPLCELRRMSGVVLLFRYMSESWWRIMILLERVLSRMFPQNIQHTVRNFMLWRFACRNIKKGDFDCVVTSLPGHGSLLLARKISKRFKIPLIVDFRDLPDEFDLEHKKLRMKIECWAIRRALRDAVLVTVVSPLWPIALKERFSYDDAKVSMNGYEGVLPVSSAGLAASGKLIVFYAGTMAYGRDRNFELLFDALDKLMESGMDISPIEVRIAGDYRDVWFEKLKRFKSYSVFKHIGRIPRAEAILNQQNASILLNIASPEAPGVIPSKIFEYAKARRPVLNIPSKSDVLAQFVLESKIGECCETVDEIAEYIERKLVEWRRNGCLPDPTVKMEYLKQFSREFQAQRFYEYIKESVKK